MKNWKRLDGDGFVEILNVLVSVDLSLSNVLATAEKMTWTTAMIECLCKL